MTVTLPYEFDSSGVVKTILRLVLALLGVVVAGILYTLFISHNKGAAALLGIIGALIILFGRLVITRLKGNQGTITAEAALVRPVTVYGLRLAGAAGRFPIRQLEAVRVEQSSGPVEAQGGTNELVSLVGPGGTPDILVARTERGAGKLLGRELATALGLQYQETRTPY